MPAYGPSRKAAFCEPGFAGARWMSRVHDPYPPADLPDAAPAEFRDILNRYDACVALGLLSDCQRCQPYS